MDVCGSPRRSAEKVNTSECWEQTQSQACDRRAARILPARQADDCEDQTADARDTSDKKSDNENSQTGLAIRPEHWDQKADGCNYCGNAEHPQRHPSKHSLLWAPPHYAPPFLFLRL